MRFLANARNDRILYGIRGSSGVLLNKTPLLPLHITHINVVIPNESRVAGEVRNLQKEKLNPSKKRNTFNIHNSRYTYYIILYINLLS
jgi:hypothetical protein